MRWPFARPDDKEIILADPSSASQARFDNRGLAEKRSSDSRPAPAVGWPELETARLAREGPGQLLAIDLRVGEHPAGDANVAVLQNRLHQSSHIMPRMNHMNASEHY